MMLSRMADALYWMARNLERADNTARLIEINLLHLVEMEEAPFGEAQWQPLLKITGSEQTFLNRVPRPEMVKDEVVAFLTSDREYPSSILSSVQLARENARVVRDRISKEMWETINHLWLSVQDQLKKPLSPARAPLVYAGLRQQVARFHGETQDTMVRGEAYGFYWLGTLMERADMTARILDVKYHILLPSVGMVGSALDYYQWVALLKTISGFEAFRRTYHAGLRPVDVSEFILFSSIFPRSLRFCINRLSYALEDIGFHRPETRTCQALQSLQELIQQNTAESVFEQGLHEFLQETLRRIAALDRAVQADCFEAYLGEALALSD